MMRILLAVFFGAVTSVAVGQDHEAALENYLTDDVVAVAYLDVSQIDTLGLLEWAEKLGLGPKTGQRSQANNLMLKIQQQVDTFADSGARYVYALFRVSDMTHGGPTWVVPVAENGNPRAVMGMILSGRPDRWELELDARPGFFPEHCEIAGDAVLGANSEEQLEKLKTTRTKNPRDLSAAWKALGQGHCGLLIFGNRDSRRVVREMFPALPAPFAAIDGELLGKHLQWGGLVADLPPDPKLEVLFQTDQRESAEVMQKAIQEGLSWVERFPYSQQFLSADELHALGKSLAPKISGERVMITFEDMLSDLQRIAKLLAPPVKAARQAANRSLRINRFKNILLAMLNYESARGTYPPRSTFSDDGKPLLSWRVHILPYLEGGGELYNQFRLDEPWDSEHNKQLIPLMPEVYADPDPALSQRNAAGRTTFVVPTGPRTVFEGPEPVEIKEIIDGTSNTIMLVEVWSMAGPNWTEPKDWFVDTNNLWERLPRGDRDWFTAGFCDGSVQIIHRSVSEETLRALLSKSGRETVNRP